VPIMANPPDSAIGVEFGNGQHPMGTSTNDSDRFDSWKQIAAYLNKSERTVRRWHDQEGLPVHKHQHRERGSVWAYRAELDDWLAGRTLSPEPESSAVESAPVPIPPPRRKWPYLTALGAGIVLTLGFIVMGSGNRVDRIIASAPITASPGSEYGASFSPDGKQIVYHWDTTDGEANGLYTKELGQEYAKPLVVGARGKGFRYSPAWSPDGSTIAFLERTSETWLNLVDASGGTPRRIRQIAVPPVLYFGNHQHISWTQDSQWVIVPMGIANYRGVYRISVKTADAVSIVASDSAYAPALSPDGRLLAWMRKKGMPIAYEEILITRLNPGNIAVGEPTVLFKGRSFSSGIAWAAGGDGLYFCTSFSTMMGSAQSAVYSVAPNGPAPLRYLGGDRCSTVTVMPNGTLALGTAPNARSNLRQVNLLQPGPPRDLAVSSRYDSEPAISPDGGKIAFYSNRSGQPEVWIVHSDGTGLRRITENSGIRSSLAWSPSGNEIVYASGSTLFITALDGSQVSRIETGGEIVQHPAWSSRNNTIYYITGTQLSSTQRDGSQRKLLRELPDSLALAADYDGKYLYYSRSANPFVLCRVPVDGGPEEIVEETMALPSFAISRHAAYVFHKDRGLYAVPLKGGPASTQVTGPPVDMFSYQGWESRLAVAPDDSYIVSVRSDPVEIDLESWMPQNSRFRLWRAKVR